MLSINISGEEEKQLTAKLDFLEFFGDKSSDRARAMTGKSEHSGNTPEKVEEYRPDGTLAPEAYSEEGASREVHFSERELNALLAKNTDLAKKVAIDLGKDLISAKLIVNVDPDFPVFGGQTVRVRAGLEVAYGDKKPVVKIKGVSLMGVPLPNAWLGGMKNVDLVREFGTEEGFWKIFSDGVDSVTVEEGSIAVTLKE
jgi:hypothetical protein